MRKVVSLGVFLFILTVALHPMPLMSADQPAPFDVSKAIASGDHKGLAEHYKAQAEVYKKKAAEHDAMQNDYKSTHAYKKGAETSFQSHCSQLKADALSLAAKYEAMAKEEEALIKKK